MLTDYLLSVLAIAGVAVLWRNLREDLPKLEAFIGKFPWLFRKSLRCGYCSTMWISFAFLLAFDPLRAWLPAARLPEGLHAPAAFLLHWMALGFGSVALRFKYVLWQEGVHDLLHARGGHHHHHSSPTK
jgi:hypothetical protein